MEKISTINSLLKGSPGLARLSAKLAERERVKQAVCAALAPPLAAAIASAGLQDGKLTLGVVGAGWASRLRYVTESLRTQVSSALAQPVDRVRIRVVPPKEAAQRTAK